MMAAESTVAIVRTALRCDPGVPEPVRAEVEKLLTGKRSVEWLPPKEAAALRGCSVATLRRLGRAGKIRMQRLNARVLRFAREDVLASREGAEGSPLISH